MIITVRDNGAGVAPEDLARILEPFEHAGRGEGAEHAKGAGLGLTLVKAFAELHGRHLGAGQPPRRGLHRPHQPAGGGNSLTPAESASHLPQILMTCDSITRRL